MRHGQLTVALLHLTSCKMLLGNITNEVVVATPLIIILTQTLLNLLPAGMYSPFSYVPVSVATNYNDYTQSSVLTSTRVFKYLVFTIKLTFSTSCSKS